MQPILSVIIPVYNCERYVRRAAASVLGQPCAEHLELIIVDDGSMDKSGTICDDIATEHKNVRVFHKENGGVSSARNLGIDEANGLYLAFLDADDWWDAGVFNEELSHICSESKYDCIEFSFKKISPSRRYEIIFPCKAEVVVYDSFDLNHDGSRQSSSPFFYNRALVNRHDIRFLQASVYEDIPFVNQCLYYSTTIMRVNKVLFYYWMNFSSKLHTVKVVDFIKEKINAFHMEELEFKRKNVYCDNSRAIVSLIVEKLQPLCAALRYSELKVFLNSDCCELFWDSQVQPWKKLQIIKKRFLAHPKLFWLKNRVFHWPSFLRKVVLWFSQTSTLPEWVHYRILARWKPSRYHRAALIKMEK